MLIVSDLDRTLLPNGDEPDEGLLLQCIELIKKAGHTLVYSTGRNKAQFEEAQETYGIPLPDYLFADVGTTLFQTEHGTLIQDEAWSTYIQTQTPNWNWQEIVDTIHNTLTIDLQESFRQNTFKVSFYHDLSSGTGATITASLQKMLRRYNTQVIYSIDHQAQVGLIDILPACATKATALTYMKERLSLADDEVIFSGDSGNDVLALTAGYNAIVVANATDEVKQEVLRIAEEQGVKDNIYIARGTATRNGNYSSGVLEGLVHHGALTKTSVDTVLSNK